MSDNDDTKYRMEIISEDKGCLEQGDDVLRFPNGHCVLGLPAAVVELNRLHAIVDKIPGWIDDLIQAQNQLHGIRNAGMGSRSVSAVAKAMRRADEPARADLG